MQEAEKIIKNSRGVPCKIEVKEKTNIAELILRLMENKFYGSLELKFESGKIVHCSKKESIKL